MRKTVALTFTVDGETEKDNNSLANAAFGFVKEMGGQMNAMCVHEEPVPVENMLDTVLAKLKDVLPNFPGKEPWQEGGEPGKE